MGAANEIISLIRTRQDVEEFQRLNWKGGFEDYLEVVVKNPRVTRSAFQRMYDMIVSHGIEEYSEHKRKILRYKFFDDAENGGADAIYGLEQALMKMVSIFKSAAQRYGTEKRILLLHGPVGSAKSTIVRLLKKGIENYSKTPEGALYTFGWRDETAEGERYIDCPMHEEPLHLIPEPLREEVLAQINERCADPKHLVTIEGELCPACRFQFNELMRRCDGDWTKVVRHVEVHRLLLSEKDRVGIGTFQPKDEKNQDSTELTGDINYRKIAEYGSDSDPRAFNFDGEFNIANRGIIEFIEVLKLDVAFLYDLLGASQEHKIKPKKFSQTDIDEVIIGHTNEPEYRKLQSNEFMEALRDRTVKIDVPYITRLKDEVRIYERDFNRERIRHTHIAPHTLETAAMWAVLTRLEEPKKASLNLVQKLRLYNGQSLPGFTEENVKELRRETVREGLDGISPRYIQDKISNALVSDEADKCINPFMVLNELESGLLHHSLINSEDLRKRYKDLLAQVKEEYEDIVKNEVQRAISADEDAITKLCANYVDNIKAYTQKEKVKNKYTGEDEEPDERLMRSIEEKIGIPENRKDDFRREIMNYIGALAIDGKTFDYKTNARLQKALELKLFEDQKDSIKLTNLVSSVVDKETQAKIDVVKQRLIRNMGYCDICATDVLNFVASIFARGDVKRFELVQGAEARMVQRIDRDLGRFRQVVRGIVKKELRKYMVTGELVGRQGKDIVSIPIRQIEIPTFRHETRRFGGVGQGEGEPGTPVGADGSGAGAAGDAPGEHVVEVDVSLDELAQIMAEELELPNIQPRSKDVIEAEHGRFSGIHRTGPESLRHFRRTFREALKRQMASGSYDFNNPVIIPIKDDRRYRSRRTIRAPETNAVIIYIMDVSGSMGDEQKDIVRNESFWINTWLRRQYKGVATRFIVHDAEAREVDEHTFFHTRESGGTRISSAYQLTSTIIDEECPPSDWNVYVFHFSDGDNWGGGDTQVCIKLLAEKILPAANLFCYGQVASPYGSGAFVNDLAGAFTGADNVVLAEIGSREEIYDSIRKFLGKGR